MATNQNQIKKMQAKANALHLHLQEELGSSTMDMIDRLIEIELLLEAESNK